MRIQTPKIDIIVTQHATLVELLLERGVIDRSTPVIDHARPDDVRGKHVLGVLPHHLSSQASTITEIPIRFADATERRAFAGGDIPLERLRQIAGEPVTYTVECGWRPETTIFPVSTEPHPNGRDAWICGGDRTSRGPYYISPLALRSIVPFHTDDLGHYRDGGSWVIQGLMRVDLRHWQDGMVRLSSYHTASEHAIAGLDPLPWSEAIMVPCAVVMAVERHDLDDAFAPSAKFGSSAAIMQHEPLVLFANGKRARIRTKAYCGDLQSAGLEVVEVVGDDGLLDFLDRDGETIRGRCHNEAALIVIAERELAARASKH